MNSNSSLTDKIVLGLDSALRSTLAKPNAKRAIPEPKASPTEALNDTEKKRSIELMRVNHTGEVCAQALYQGQALTARSQTTKDKMSEAADEEIDHLNWCNQRLDKLGGRPSLLNPIWYAGSFSLGAIAGLAGDKWNLGFLMETENQVEAHLAEHLDKLPENDLESRAVVEQMKIDEAKHASMAEESGAAELPAPIKATMQFTALIMKGIAAKI